MINKEKTILASIKKYFDNLRFLANYDTKDLPNFLRSVITYDFIDWMQYKGLNTTDINNKLSIFLKLTCGLLVVNDLRSNYIIKNICTNPTEEFKSTTVSYTPIENCSVIEGNYISVNCPYDVTDLQLKVESVVYESINPKCTGFKLDKTYSPILITFVNEKNKSINHPDEGVLDLTTATVHEKMNIYLNRKNGTLWYLDNESCDWKELNTSILPTLNEHIDNAIRDNWGVEQLTNDNTIVTKLSKTSLEGIINYVDEENDIEDVL